MSKDKIIGAIVILLGLAIAVLYTMGSIVDLMALSLFDSDFDITSGLIGFDIFDWKYFTVVPIWIVVILVAIIAIWIGYSMLTTPAPVPLEELEEELAAEEEELKIEEEEEED
jgi:predicted DNA-binding transcriptional regulator